MAKILLVTDSYLPTISGVTTVVSEYAFELKNLDHSVKILAPFHKSVPHTKDTIPVKGIKNPFRLDTVIPLQFYAIRKQIEQFNPDVVHIHSPSFLGFWARAWAMHSNTKLVITVHGIPNFLAKYLPFSRYYTKLLTKLGWMYWKWFLQPSDVIIAPSHFIIQELKKLRLKPAIIRVPFWIEKYQKPRHVTSESKTVHFLFFGRLDPDKNLKLLIKGWSLVQQKNKHLTIAGRNLKNQRQKLQSLAKKLGCETSVTILGTVHEKKKADLFCNTDFFVMPSNVEVQSITTLQAALSGIPVLVADASALSEIVESSSLPHLKFKQNNTRLLAEKISDCCQNVPSYTKKYTLDTTFKSSFSKKNVLATLTKDVYNI